MEKGIELKRFKVNQVRRAKDKQLLCWGFCIYPISDAQILCLLRSSSRLLILLLELIK
jgi:hypothetical protein